MSLYTARTSGDAASYQANRAWPCVVSKRASIQWWRSFATIIVVSIGRLYFASAQGVSCKLLLVSCQLSLSYRKPRDTDAAVVNAVAAVHRDQQGRQTFHNTSHSSGPASIGRKPGINSTREKRVFLAASSSPHTRMSQSGVRDRSCSAWADRLWNAARYRRAGRRQLANLLGGGSLPNAQHPGRLASCRGGQGNGRVHQNGIFERTSNALQDSCLRGERTAMTTTEAWAAACEFSHPLTSRLCGRGDPPRSPFPSAVRLRPEPSSHRASR